MAEKGTNGTNGQGYVGTRTIRPDGVDKVTGRARFGADFNLPGQLIGRVLRSPHPHARIVRIDTSKAEALPGVKAVITRDDFGDQPKSSRVITALTPGRRSEEHTSELQSRPHLVCRLLLETQKRKVRLR